MRRLLAISLLFLFGLPLVSPLFALGEGSEANLPICCRRNGAHHCMGMMQAATTQGTQLSVVHDKCPLYPHAATSARHNELSLHTPELFFAEIVSHPATKPQTLARARVALDRSRQKRGPPALQA